MVLTMVKSTCVMQLRYRNHTINAAISIMRWSTQHIASRGKRVAVFSRLAMRSRQRCVEQLVPLRVRTPILTCKLHRPSRATVLCLLTGSRLISLGFEIPLPRLLALRM